MPKEILEAETVLFLAYDRGKADVERNDDERTAVIYVFLVLEMCANYFIHFFDNSEHIRVYADGSLQHPQQRLDRHGERETEYSNCFKMFPSYNHMTY
jgi:hypothetical protein